MPSRKSLLRSLVLLPLFAASSAACERDILQVDTRADAGPGSMEGAGGPGVPHKEHTRGVIDVSVFVSATVVFQSWTAEGNGTHIGRYTQFGSHYADLVTGQIFGGVFHSTAADGATVSGTYAGTFAIAGDGAVTYDVSPVWTQGTGRLAGVTGTGDVHAVATGVEPGSTFRYETNARWQLPARK